MSQKKYKGVPYHLWNPFTVMDEFLPYLEVGPLVISKGDGPFVYNDRGQKFINGFSSLWNVALGHGRKDLIEAATKQMSELAFASCFRQSHPRAIELAAKLVEITAHKYEHVYLASNGSEAIETAIKMSRQYFKQSPKKNERDRYKIISLKGCYHGVSYGAVSTSGLEADTEKFGPLIPGFSTIDPPYCYRCPYGKTNYPECGLTCADALENKIHQEEAHTIAAFIMEPVMGAYGFIDPPKEYYKKVGEICKKYGLLFIVDEVTTGFGRTGKLFASEDWDPIPDIMCLGKAISSGYLPLAATLATEDIYQRFKGRGNQFDHGSTSSGHPVCAAVGLVNIDIIINEKLSENAARIGDSLKAKLSALKGKHPVIGDVRGQGLMIGIELVKDKDQKTPYNDKKIFDFLVDAAIHGLLLYGKGNILGLMPPLIIDEEIADTIADILDKVCDTSLKANIARKARMAKEFAAAKLMNL